MSTEIIEKEVEIWLDAMDDQKMKNSERAQWLCKYFYRKLGIPMKVSFGGGLKVDVIGEGKGEKL